MLTSVTFSKPHRIPQRKTARAGPAFPLQAPLDSLTLAASVVIQQDVARRAGAEVRPRLVYTLMLAEELREAAFSQIWGQGGATALSRAFQWLGAWHDHLLFVKLLRPGGNELDNEVK